MFAHHLAHHLVHELQVLVDPLAHLFRRHPSARFGLLHLRHASSIIFICVLHQFLALGPGSGLRGGKLLLRLLYLLVMACCAASGPAMLASGNASATAASAATKSFVFMFI
jgi:hypothetical protein